MQPVIIRKNKNNENLLINKITQEKTELKS